MASSGCLKCLARPSALQLSTALHVSRTAAFSTTATNGAKATGDMLKKQQAKGAHLKKRGATSTLKIKKKVPIKSGKPPMPGERKALRKRVVLSNTNALDVGMTDMTAAMVADETLVGKVVGLDANTVDCLRAAEAFKPNQSWKFFQRPGLLIREESVVLARKLVATEEKKETLKLMLDGDRVTGKSLMLVHAMATASLRGWVVLNIPEGMFFCFSHVYLSTNSL